MVPRRNFVSAEDEKKYKLSTKLQYRYTGPHTISIIINPVTYEVNIDGIKKVIHADRMKRDSRRDVSRKDVQRQRRSRKRLQTSTQEKEDKGPPGDHPITEGDHLLVMSTTCPVETLHGEGEDIEFPYGV